MHPCSGPASPPSPPPTPSGLEPLEPRLLLSASTIQWQPLGEPGSGGRIDAIHVSPHDADRVLIAGDILGTGLSENGGQTWQPTVGFDSWEHSDFTSHPNPAQADTIWAATLSGPHLSTDGGHTWEPRRNGLPDQAGTGYEAAVEKILYDHGDTTRDTLLAFGGDNRQLKDFYNPEQLPNYGKVWGSTNGGESWAELADSGGNIMAADRVAGSPGSYWVAVADRGVFLSSNDGEAGTWSARSDGLPTLGGANQLTGLVAHPTDPDVAFATVGTLQRSGDASNLGGIFKTTDRGDSWVRVEAGVAPISHSSEFRHLDISGDGNTLWAADTSYGGSKGFWRSIDGGDAWTQVVRNANIGELTTGGSPFVGGGTVSGRWVEIDANDPSGQTVYAGTTVTAFKTTDGGVSWNDILNDSTGNGTFRGNGYTGWVATNAEFSPFDPDLLVTQGDDKLKVGVSHDAGFSWRINQEGMPPFSGGKDVTFAADGTLYAAMGQRPDTAEHVARSTDDGLTWEVLPSPGVRGLGQSVHVNRADANEFWAVIGDTLFQSSNAAGPVGEVVWRAVEVDSVDGEPVRVEQIGGVLDKNDNFYVSTSNGVYFTGDGGGSFSALGGPSRRVQITVDPSDASVVWAAANGDWREQGLYRFDGSAWKSFSLPGGADYWAKKVAVDPTDPNRVVLLTAQDPYVDQNEATGVWISEDGGTTWSNENANLPMLRGAAATFSPDGQRLIIGTGGRGFFTADLGRTTVGAQAERLTLGGGGGRSFLAGVDVGATDGGLIEVPNGSGNNWNASADAPIAQFFFTLDAAESGVSFRGRVQTPGSGSDNSFFVRVNGGDWQLWDTPTSTNGWAWGTVSNRGGGVLTTNLDAGDHLLEFKLREDGTRLDEVEIRLQGAAGTSPR